MDESSFKEAVRIAEQYGDALDAAGSPAEQVAEIYGSRPESYVVLISLSKKSQTYWDGVKLIVRQMVERGEPLPSELGDWAVEVATNALPRPPGTSDAHEVLVRDRLIHVVGRMLIARGFKPIYRRRDSIKKGDPGRACAEGGSICDVIGRAFGMNYDAVARAWGSWRGLERAAESWERAQSRQRDTFQALAESYLNRPNK